jgi:hypothetical protein
MEKESWNKKKERKQLQKNYPNPNLTDQVEDYCTLSSLHDVTKEKNSMI